VERIQGRQEPVSAVVAPRLVIRRTTAPPHGV
jgi:LacI family transcriptional regulator